MVRLVASDLDGTLFGADHVPEPRTVAAVNALRTAGVVVVAATGRSHLGGVDLATSTGAGFDWFIGSNGAHRLRMPDRLIEEQLTFGVAQVRSLIEEVGARIDPAIGTEHSSGFNFTPEFLDLFPEVGPGRSRVSTASFREDDVAKLLVANGANSGHELLELLGPIVESHDVHMTCSGAPFVEFTPAGATKGEAIARLCHRLGIDAADVVAFGDNHNDLTMLRWAGRGIAMGNAIESVQAAADEVTATNVDFGVAAVLEQILEDCT